MTAVATECVYAVEVNKYAHSGSSFSRELYPGERFSLTEAKRIADERGACGVDRFVIVKDAASYKVVYTAKIA